MGERGGGREGGRERRGGGERERERDRAHGKRKGGREGQRKGEKEGRRSVGSWDGWREGGTLLYVSERASTVPFFCSPDPYETSAMSSGKWPMMLDWGCTNIPHPSYPSLPPFGVFIFSFLGVSPLP